MRLDPDSHLPVLLGEAPSKSGDRFWMVPCSGGPAKAIVSWMGREIDSPPPGGNYWRLVESFETLNLLERYPGPQGVGAAFPTGPARQAWADLLPELPGRVVVMLGSRLATVAGLPGVHEWAFVGDAWVVAIPHPSGLNRVYNDPAERRRSAGTLRHAMALAAP